LKIDLTTVIVVMFLSNCLYPDCASGMQNRFWLDSMSHLKNMMAVSVSGKCQLAQIVCSVE